MLILLARPSPTQDARALPRYRILALDVDGTLLDRAGHLRPATRSAIRRASEAGIIPVLCTGRRYRRARPIAELLGLTTPLVCNSGGLIKAGGDHATLWRADLDPATAATVLEVYCERGEDVITFTDAPPDQPDFLLRSERSGRPLFDDYVVQNREHAEVDPTWPTRRDVAHYHLCGIGPRDAMLDLERALVDRLGAAIQTFVQRSPRYLGTICEVLRGDATKWSALVHLARSWDIDPGAICAVGDDRNDIPMIAGAGLGVAMGHADAAVRAVADHVTGSDDEDGVARLVDEVLLRP